LRFGYNLNSNATNYSLISSTALTNNGKGVKAVRGSVVGNNASNYATSGITLQVWQSGMKPAGPASGASESDFTTQANSVVSTLKKNPQITVVEVTNIDTNLSTTWLPYYGNLKTTASSFMAAAKALKDAIKSAGLNVKVAIPAIAYSSHQLSFLAWCVFALGASGSGFSGTGDLSGGNISTTGMTPFTNYGDYVDLHIYPNTNLASGGPLSNFPTVNGTNYNNSGSSGYMDCAYALTGNVPQIITEFSITSGNGTYSGSNAKQDFANLYAQFESKGYVYQVYIFGFIASVSCGYQNPLGGNSNSGNAPYSLYDSSVNACSLPYMIAAINLYGDTDQGGGGGSPLTVSAVASITQGNAPLSVSFTSSAIGGTSPYSYLWNFGDGTAQSTTQNPNHTYQNPGTFTATLTVTDSANNTAQSSVVITVTQQVGGGNGTLAFENIYQTHGNTSPLTLGVSTTQNYDTIFIVISGNTSGVTFGVSDSAGLTWKKLVDYQPTGITSTTSVFYAVAASPETNDTVTVTFSKSDTIRIDAIVISGINTNAILDGTVVTASNSGSTSTSATISTTNLNDMIIALATIAGNPTITYSSGFTSLTPNQSSPILAGEYKIVSAAQSNLTVSMGLSASEKWSMVLFAVQQASAPPPVTKTNTVTTLTYSPDPVTLGQSTTLNIIVTGSSPTGTITLTTTDPSGVFGSRSLTLDVNGQASTTYTPSADGYNVTASYGGDSDNNSSSIVEEILVSPPETVTVVIINNGNPVPVGQSATIQIEVFGSSPTGTVILSSSDPLSSFTAQQATLSNGVATVGYQVGTLGIFTITAVYSGDTNNNASSGSSSSVSSPAGISSFQVSARIGGFDGWG
jgi:hypothetical protein